jgi:hypothetical protein
MTTENVKKLFYKNKTMNYLNVCYYRFLRENKLIICAAGHIGQPIKLIDDNILPNEDYSLIINVDETPLCMNFPYNTITTKR